MQPYTEVWDLLRQEVGQLRTRESRRRFDVTVFVGRLGGPRDSFVVWSQDLPTLDAALRVDLVCSLVSQTGPDCRTAWLTRPGTTEECALDLAWWAAARTAFAIHGRSLEGFFALTRTGWRDVSGTESRSWKRLRL